MTRQRNDNHSTEFGLWLRGQYPQQKIDVSQIDSRIGYTTSNIDYVWKNYQTNEWMMIEEKRFSCLPTWSQYEIFKYVTLICKKDTNFKGFYIIQFENTTPENGEVRLINVLDSKKNITIKPQELLEFLQFKK